MKDLNGFSIIIGKGVFYVGRYKGGVWFDNCEELKLPKEKRIGWGFKIDLCIGRMIRPIGIYWNSGYWDNEKLKIQNIPKNTWDAFFGKNLSDRIKKLPTDRLKHGVYNPWYAKHWFVLRLHRFIPTIFVSVGLGKLLSFYIGSKSYGIDPFTRDVTWTNKADEKRARIEDPKTKYYAFCPSASLRSTRMT